MKRVLLLPIAWCLFHSCTVGQKISKQAKQLINDTAVSTGHIGISIYDPAEGKYLYNYNGDHYFIPASNTKLATCYAAMKYLGDSLVGLKYSFLESDKEKILLLSPSGDPTLLHPDFKSQRVFDFLQNSKDNYTSFVIDYGKWKERPLGYGWAWDDYNEDYMAERSLLPVFGNVLTIKRQPEGSNTRFLTIPFYFSNAINTIFWEGLLSRSPNKFRIGRHRDTNQFWIESAKSTFTSTTTPFATMEKEMREFSPIKEFHSTASSILIDTLKKTEKTISKWYGPFISGNKLMINDNPESLIDRRPDFLFTGWQTIHSQPTDSVLKPMMHVSDNFFAEQSLLMVSNEKLGYMNDADIIDTLLKTDLKGLPQRPKWVDGSGLSRYNLFTPQDFIYILDKMSAEFGQARVENILATGGQGTLKNYFLKDSGFVFAKTGTLSNNCALSGYVYTKKGKRLIFSILTNNYITGATAVRRATERFIAWIRANY